MQQKIIILDFGSQTTQLIGRRVRELDTFCEILPYNKFPHDDPSVIGVILSGSPLSVYADDAFHVDLSRIRGRLPILGICYGAQYMSHIYGGRVESAGTREYGRQNLQYIDKECPLFRGFDDLSQVWMSHGDSITKIPEGAHVVASTETVENAAWYIPTSPCPSKGGESNLTMADHSDFTEPPLGGTGGAPVFGVQFHPEVFHSLQGSLLLKNFVVDVCGSRQDWSADAFVETTVRELKEQIGNDQVILGLSGGVDSSVAAVLLNKAIGRQLTCIFVDHGMLRKNEFQDVMKDYECLGLNVVGVDASEKFLSDLAGVREPEQKRKIIGRDFVEVFDAEAKRIINESKKTSPNPSEGGEPTDTTVDAGVTSITPPSEGMGEVKWLAQGTIYPDRIESLNITGKVIKSHHNVGGLPEEMHLSLCEPLKWLFKDEVRRVGRSMGMPEHLITRHPFPGPGLAVRILGDITREKVRILQEADDIYIRGLREYKVKMSADEAKRLLAAGCPANLSLPQTGESEGGLEVSLYDQIWQAGAILLSDVRSVGVMGDERTYENPVALRAVTSSDAMTADWAHLPYDFMARVSNDIINKVKGVNRVCYDISSKPPSTIEWE